MSRTNGRARRSKSAGGPDDDPPHHVGRGARKRRVWFAAAAVALAAIAVTTAAAAGLVMNGDTPDRPPAISSSITISPDMKAQRAGLNVHRQSRPPQIAPKYTYAWPVEGPITQGMSDVHPLGIDIDTGYGATIRTARAGTVVTAGGDPCCSYGYHVIVEHPDGFRSLYAHLSGISVAVGDIVLQGDLIGFSGDTGRSTGTHLHFEL